MKSLFEKIGDNMEFEGTDFHKFIKDYKKFCEKADEIGLKGDEKHAYEEIGKWVELIQKKEGLPSAYPSYNEFLNAILTYDPSLNDGKGGFYDDSISHSLLKIWKEATGQSITIMNEIIV